MTPDRKPGLAAGGLDQHSLAALLFEMTYRHDGIRHRDRRLAAKVNLWRDIFPGTLDQALTGKRVGERVSQQFGPGTLVPSWRAAEVKTIRPAQFDARLYPGTVLEPDPGRFLPQGLLHKAGIGGIYRQNIQPMRICRCDADGISVDLNHPLAQLDLEVSAEIIDLEPNAGDVGGRANDWIRALTAGPGMELQYEGRPSLFEARDWNARPNEEADSEFYAQPRMTDHMDRRALSFIAGLYGRLVRGGKVLDLMSSLHSHLPADSAAEITGLGLNGAEMAANQRLGAAVIHDLNRDPVLPFDAGSFDAAVNTASIEYLTQPRQVMAELARVLKPGAPLIVTFSNRWFPPKAIKLWTELHAYERIGYVLDLFLQSGAFEKLESLRIHGYPRPEDDPHSGQTPESDPVFAVWGFRKG